MSFDSISEESNTGADNGVTNGHKKPTEPEASPGSSGRHSRNKSRERSSPTRHGSRKSDRSSQKKKKREKSSSPRRARSRSVEKSSSTRDRSRRDRSRGGGRDDKRDDRRRDSERGSGSKRDKKGKRDTRDRSPRTPPFSRKRDRNYKRRKSSSSESSDEDLTNLKKSSTLFGLFKDEVKSEPKEKKSKSKRRRRASSSSSSSSEDTRDSKTSAVPTTSTAINPAVLAAYSAYNMQVPMAQFGLVQPQPPPPQLAGGLPSFPPPPPPPIPPPQPPMLNVPPPLLHQPPMAMSYPPPPGLIPPPTLIPPPSMQQPSLAPPLPPVPLPPAIPPLADQPSTSTPAHAQARIPLPRTARRYDQPVVLNKPIRDIDKTNDWGSGFVEDKYIRGEQVGEGTYGQVYKAKSKTTGEQVALKKVRLDNEKEGFPITAVREIKILRQLNHVNVVKLHDIVTDQKHAHESRSTMTNFYLVFEYVDHDLTGLLSAINDRRIPEFKSDQVASLFKQLIQGLDYCHTKKFLHRDIKCSNILVNNRGELKIADWGLARLYQEDVVRPYTNRVITLWYRPPELLLGEEHYGPAVDVWSAGCILAEFFTKKAIFCGQNEPHQLELISKECGTPTKENWPDVDKLSLYKTLTPKSTYYRRLKDTFRAVMPDAALDLMDKMLIMDPSRRITASTALRHHWVKDIDPRRVQPLQLPVGQDCHELWSKQERNKRRSGLPVAPLATTMALPPPADPYIKREPKREPSVEVKPAIPPQMPAVHSVNGDSSAILAFHQAFDRFHQDPGPQARMHLQRILDTLDEEHAHDLVHRLSSLIKDKNLLTMQRSYKEKLQMMVENILAQKPSPSHQQQPPPRGAPPPGPPPPFHGRPPPLPVPGRPHHPYHQPPPPQQQHGGAPPYRMYR